MRTLLCCSLLLAACSRAPSPAPTEPARTTAQVQRALMPDAPPPPEDLEPDPKVLHVKLVAAPKLHQLTAASGSTPNAHVQPVESIAGYAYNGQLPGPTLRAKVGDTLRVELENKMGVGTTIHWHGVHVPVEMDGVTWQKDPIGPGETFTYEYTLTHAGTFWYHPHFDTERQVDRGLYGALIVEDAADPVPDRELVLIFDGWDENPDEDEDAEGGEEEAHVHGNDAVIERWMVNGAYQPTFVLEGGTWARVRMINASNAGYVDLRLPEILHVGSDQGRLAALGTPDRLILGPGDRSDILLRIGKEGFEVQTAPYSLHGGQALEGGDATWTRRQTLFTVSVDQPADAPSTPEFPWSKEAPSPDPSYTDVLYTFSGSSHTGEWLINGESFPDVTIEEAPLNATRIIEVRNLSPTEHPFHLHGHGFEVLSIDGEAPEYQRFEDTINVPIRSRVRLKLIANNPGDWMTHCHILPHAHQGMMTVFRVLEE